MKAYRLIDWQSLPVFEDVPVPDPGPGEVLIKVAASGACHSDLHIMEYPADMLPWKVPFTLGHETTGWVERLGPGVTNLDVGRAVAVYGAWGCGGCRACRLGMENYCEHSAELGTSGGGLGRDGGMAEFMLVPSARLLVPVDGLDPVEAAPLMDAGLTPYHAIKRSLHLLGPGAAAVVIGVGGLGHMGLQILRALSTARIIAVDLSAEKLRLAKELGADDTVPSDAEAAGRIRELTHGRGAEVVLDFVGNDATIAIAAAIGRPLGHVTIVGAAGGTFPFSFFALPYECSLATTYWGTIPELMELLGLARQGRIAGRIERFSLDAAPEAYERMRAGTLGGRAVITPD